MAAARPIFEKFETVCHKNVAEIYCNLLHQYFGASNSPGSHTTVCFALTLETGKQGKLLKPVQTGKAQTTLKGAPIHKTKVNCAFKGLI